MKSIKYLQEQVEIYATELKLNEETQKKYRDSLQELQKEREGYKSKYENYKSLLEMVEEDFEKYGWNPAG